MIDIYLPFLAGLCLGAAATLIITRKLTISGTAARQALATLTTLYASLADDGKLSDAERAEIREEVRKLIEQLKNTTTMETT